MATTTLTFAELAFLLADADAEIRSRLSLLDWEIEGPVVMSGGASLVARDLLRQEGSELRAHESLVPALECFVRPDTWVSLGTVRGDNADEMRIFDAPTGRFVTTVLPYGALQIDVLDTETSVAAVVAQIVTTFITDEQPGAAFVGRLPNEPDDGLAVRRNPDGTIEVAKGHVKTAEIRTVEADAVSGLVHEFLS